MEGENLSAARPCPDLARFIHETREALPGATADEMKALETILACFDGGDDQWPGDPSYLTETERRDLAAALKGS